MKLQELYDLREEFWQLNRTCLVVFRKLIVDPGDGSTLKGQPDKLLEGCDTFLNALLQKTTDPDLRADIEKRIGMIAAQRGTPFASLR